MLSSNSYEVTDSMGADGNSWTNVLPSNEVISIDGSVATANNEDNTSVYESTSADTSDDTISDAACDIAESKTENSALDKTIIGSPKNTRMRTCNIAIISPTDRASAVEQSPCSDIDGFSTFLKVVFYLNSVSLLNSRSTTWMQ